MSYKKPFKKVASSANTLHHGPVKNTAMRRLILSTLLIVACLVTTGSIYWYRTTINAKLDSDTRALQDSLKAIDAQIAAAKERKAAELKAKRDAATRTAEQAKTVVSVEDALIIDSKSCTVSSTHNDPSSIDVVVNKKNCLQPLNYEPADLETVYGATLNSKAVESFRALYEAAAQAGQPFSVTSSYRSYANQITTYRYWVATSGYDEADTYSSRPGYSEHQTGFAMDLAAGGCTLDCFGSTDQYTWLQAHAADYGFIQRYYAGSEAITGYKAEEWHYRYVGVAVAQDMKSKGIKTLEEYWGIEGGGY